jgi:hypothetical protein
LSKLFNASYTRRQARTLSRRLLEPRRFIQVVAAKSTSSSAPAES